MSKQSKVGQAIWAIFHLSISLKIKTRYDDGYLIRLKSTASGKVHMQRAFEYQHWQNTLLTRAHATPGLIVAFLFDILLNLSFQVKIIRS